VLSRHRVAGDRHPAQGTRGVAGRWRSCCRYGTQHPFSVRKHSGTPVSTTCIDNQPDTDRTQTGWRPAPALAGRRQQPSLPGGSRHRYTTTLYCNSIAGCQDATRRHATDTERHQEQGKREQKTDTNEASASAVGPHGGGSETQGAPECAAGREPDNSTRGNGAFAPQRGGPCHSALTAWPEYSRAPAAVSSAKTWSRSRCGGPMWPYRTRNVQKAVVRSSNSCLVRGLAGPFAASLPVPPGSDAAAPAYVWLLRTLRSQ
jgi:hypothetical protein